jgi:hypothetical protein
VSVVQPSWPTYSHVDSELRITRSRVQKKKRRPQRVVEGATTRAAMVMAMIEKRYSASFSANTSWTHGTTGKLSLPSLGVLRGEHRFFSRLPPCPCLTVCPRPQSLPPGV